MNYEKMLGRMFQKCENIVWDLMTGRVGVKTEDGIVSLALDENNAEDSQVEQNLFDDFGMAIPAFAQSTPVAAINVGDLIYSSATKKPSGWVVKKTEKSFRVMKLDGTVSQWNPPKVNMLGLDSGVLILRSLMNMTGQAGLGQMQSSMMPLMMMGMVDGESDMSDLVPMMLMSQMGSTGADGQMNPFAGGNMMQTMMMMQMFKKLGGKSGASLPLFGAGKTGKSFFEN